MTDGWEIPKSEQRQHLNLSDHAFSVIEADIDAFLPGFTQSGFINRIVSLFWDLSDASIELACRRKEAELVLDAKTASYRKHFVSDPKLSKFDPDSFRLTEQQLELVKLLVEEHRERLKTRMNAYPKGSALKIRLQNANFDMLYKNPWEESFYELRNYNYNQGKYLKAIIEDYAERPYVERERIIFRECYDILRSELELTPNERRMLRIKLLPNKSGEAPAFDMKPYDLMTDIGGNFNYLVGISRPVPSKEDDRPVPASNRLSRIASITPKPKSYASGKITAEQRKEIIDGIRERGVPYLVGKSYDQKVLLTPEGIEQYNRILHMRPAHIPEATVKHPDGSQELVFHCTNTQIKNYFLKFGKDAQVVEPAELAEEFRAHHQAAFEAHGKPKRD